MYNEDIINTSLDYTRKAVTEKIDDLVRKSKNIKGAYQKLYELLLDYPFRKGKALRPALCISIARAVGGMAQSAVVSSAALEMYHNAFLIHDDIEDDSENRRGKETLHQIVGIPRAVNIGDATNVLALNFLLENLSTIGVTKSLHVMHEIENMARQSVEGQSMELDWVANNTFDLKDEDYFMMCTKKTCWYTFIAPCRIGYIAGNPSWKESDILEQLGELSEFGMSLGIAFQIQDDLLNLIGNEEKYGKEIGGDIFEGKRTIMLNHVIANAGKSSEVIKNIIRKPRKQKTKKEITYILKKMHQYGSIHYAQELAKKFSNEATNKLNNMKFLKDFSSIIPGEKWSCEFVDKRFITELVNYVVTRNV